MKLTLASNNHPSASSSSSSLNTISSVPNEPSVVQPHDTNHQPPSSHHPSTSVSSPHFESFGSSQAAATVTDSKWRRVDFPWSEEIKKAMKYVFKLKAFRQNQLEAINATLAGNDCFVLMPSNNI